MSPSFALAFLLMARTMVLMLALLIVATTAYLHPANPISARMDARKQRAVTPLKMAYVPDGLTPEQWKALKKKEEEERKKKNFGAGGTRGFKSRSMWSFIEAYEKGEAQHLYPVDPSKVKTGEIPLKDVPYSAYMTPLLALKCDSSFTLCVCAQCNAAEAGITRISSARKGG